MIDDNPKKIDTINYENTLNSLISSKENTSIPNTPNQPIVKKKDISKLKFMIGCPNHPNENSHFFCVDCDISFCNLCLCNHSAITESTLLHLSSGSGARAENGTNHNYVDKYEYNFSTEELIDGILNEIVQKLSLIEENNIGFFRLSGIKESFIRILTDEENYFQQNLVGNKTNATNIIGSPISPSSPIPKVKTEKEEWNEKIISNLNLNININNFSSNITENSSSQELITTEKIAESIFELDSIYSFIIGMKVKNEYYDLFKKYKTFKSNLEKFKLTSISILNKQFCSDTEEQVNVLLINDEHFKEIYLTVQKLQKGKQCLLEYLDELEKNIKKIMSLKENFSSFLSQKLKNLITEIKSEFDCKQNLQEMIFPYGNSKNVNLSSKLFHHVDKNSIIDELQEEECENTKNNTNKTKKKDFKNDKEVGESKNHKTDEILIEKIKVEKKAKKKKVAMKHN